MTPTTKPPLSRRIAAKLKAQRQQIADLQRQIEQQKRQTQSTEDRLHRIVDGSATRLPEYPNLVRLCVMVDTKQANLSNANIWEEATNQLIQSLRQELSRR